MRSRLTDFGFGFCGVYVTGLYGAPDRVLFCSFSAFGGAAWRPDEIVGDKTLGWLERRIKTWDAVWPEAQWDVEISGPWHSERWQRQRPGAWVVLESSNRGMTNAIVHRDDPLSSYEAAELHAAKRATNKRIVYRLVVRLPGRTAGELAAETWLGVVEVRRRLTDLRADGMVYRGASRICREANNRQCEWWPAMRQGELL